MASERFHRGRKPFFRLHSTCFFCSLAAALACVIFESIPAFDQMAQKLFYSHGQWLISKSFHKQWHGVVYDAPKLLIGCAAVASLGLCVAAFCSPAFRERIKIWIKPLLLLALSIMAVPGLIAVIKWLTGVHSPVDLLPYGGSHPHIGFLSHLWHYGQVGSGQSFPAGHASGGFALLAMYFFPVRPACRAALLVAGLGAGWLMGVYQMARGEHFLSHTLTTMFLAWAVILLLASWLGLPEHIAKKGEIDTQM